MRFLKELAWKVPLFVLWSQCTWFAKYEEPFLIGCVIAFVFFIMLDLIRWGLKKYRIMEKKIYIVTSGEYSDYGIDAVFTTKEKAEAYIQQKGTEYNIEEYDIDEEVEKKTQLWSVGFRVDDGGLLEATTRSFEEDKVRDTCSVELSWSGKLYITFYIDADSMDRAIKIARERFAAVKANEYIWLRLTRPYKLDKYGLRKFESFNVKTNEFIKE